MRTSCLHYRSFLLIIITVISTGSGAQDKNKVPIEETITSHTFRPRRVDAIAERIKLLLVPQGFCISAFASGTGSARMMVVPSNGTIHVTDRNNGAHLLLRDTNNDKKAAEVRTIYTHEVNPIATENFFLGFHTDIIHRRLEGLRDLRNISMTPRWSATVSTVLSTAFRVNQVECKSTL